VNSAPTLPYFETIPAKLALSQPPKKNSNVNLAKFEDLNLAKRNPYITSVLCEGM